MSFDQGHSAHSTDSAASRTIHLFPDLAAPDTPARNLPGNVRKLLLASKPLSLDAIQDELGEPRVALGEIEAALVSIGARKATVDGAEVWSLMSTADAEVLAARRADVLEALFGLVHNDDPVTAQDLADDIEGGDLVDVITEAADALAEAGALYRHDDTGAVTYDLGDGIYEKILRQGALFVARATLPELTVPIEDRSAFELAATERFEAERKAKLIAQGERDRLCTWLREKGQDPNDILHPAEPVVPGPKRDVFLWTKLVAVDDAVELEIAREERKLRAELALSQAGLDMETGRHKGVKEKVNGRLKELEQAIIDKQFARQHEAYRTPLWEEGVTLVIKASDGVTILDREPIAKGTQRVIPIDPAPPVPASVEPAKDAAVEAADDAAKGQDARAVEVREQTAQRWLASAKELLRAFGRTGLDWGKDGADAVNSLARKVHGKEKGRLPMGFADSARTALNTLLSDGLAVRREDVIAWAEAGDGEEQAAE